MTTTPQKPTAAAPTANRTPTASATGRRSPDRKARKNHNGYPISITVGADGRRVVSWYPSGVAGVGKRTQASCPTQRAALAKAAALAPGLTETAVKTRTRMALDAGDLHDRRATSFGEMAKELFEIMIDGDVAEGSLRAYASNFRTWIPANVQVVPYRDPDLHHHTSIFDALARRHASKPVVRNVGRTLGKLIKMSSQRRYLDAGSFGSRADRAEVLSGAKQAAPYPKGRRNMGVLRADCPDVHDVERLAAAADLVYPGYGSRLVTLLFASGLRMCEGLALKVDDVKIEALTINTSRQLSRFTSWPFVTDPKNGHHRTTLVWAYYADVLHSLVVDATDRDVDPGYLFPRTAAQRH